MPWQRQRSKRGDLPHLLAMAACPLLAVGASGYGLILRFYLRAQRAFGAARGGSMFGLLPLIGARRRWRRVTVRPAD